MNRLAKFVIALIMVEDFAVGLAFLAQGKWKVAGFWIAIGVVNIFSYLLSS